MYLSVSCGGTGQQWPAAGTGALGAADLGMAEALLEEVTINLTVVKVKSFSRVRLFVIPWTVVYQASQSMGSSRQEYWGGLPFPSPVDLPDPGIKPRS